MLPRDIDIRTPVSYGRYPYRRFGMKLTEEDHRIIDETMKLNGLAHMGSRTLNNLAGGGENRWKSILTAWGFDVLVRMQGIGSIPTVQQRYVEKVRRAVA